MAWLHHNGLRVLTIARHPLDVLLSAVRYSRGAPDVRQWLDGATGLPADIPGSGSQEFLDYCLSEGAERLLSVTAEWWEYPPIIRLRYEEVVRAPYQALGSVLVSLGGSDELLGQMLRKLSIARMRNTPNRHGWRGEPGHWTSLVASTDAEAIQRRHAAVFETLGYDVPPYVLSRTVAQRNWEAIA